MEETRHDWLNTEKIWPLLESHQNQVFYTAKGLSFTYTIRGGEMFVDRRSKSITRATVEKAYEKLKADNGQTIHGPKKLNVFGAPYIWALFSELKLNIPKETAD
ncbi:MAG: hypothetical protein ACLSX5_07250 [Lachnospiraceae bacterium]